MAGLEAIADAIGREEIPPLGELLDTTTGVVEVVGGLPPALATGTLPGAPDPAVLTEDLMTHLLVAHDSSAPRRSMPSRCC